MMVAARRTAPKTNPVVVENSLNELEAAKQRVKDLEAKQKADKLTAQAPLREAFNKAMADAKARYAQDVEQIRSDFKARGLVLGSGAGVGIAEGARMFALAGKPTKAELILVYGEKGPKMTWAQRAAAGVPAEQFQEALKAKRRVQ
jgi:hypothetical protein